MINKTTDQRLKIATKFKIVTRTTQAVTLNVGAIWSSRRQKVITPLILRKGIYLQTV